MKFRNIWEAKEFAIGNTRELNFKTTNLEYRGHNGLSYKSRAHLLIRPNGEFFLSRYQYYDKKWINIDIIGDWSNEEINKAFFN